MLKSVAATVGLDAQGQLEVFATNSDGALWEIQQVRIPAGITGWSNWQSLGNPPGLQLGVLGSTAPSVATNADGRLEVFVIGPDNALWHTWQIDTVGGGWSGWQSLGGSMASLPAVGRNGDGRLEAFSKGTDGALWHIWQVAPNSPWSQWASLGGTCNSFPVVGLNRGGPLDKCLEVFVIGNDFPVNHMYHLWQLVPSGGWSGWTSLGGYILPDPSLGQNQDGRLEIFAIGDDVFSGSNTTHNWQLSPGTTQYSGFSSLGNPPPGTVSAQVAGNQDGRLEIFGDGGDNALWHNWQVVPNGTWSGWGSLGVPGPGTGVLFAIGSNQDGRLEVFAVGTDGNLWHIWQVLPNSGWSGWSSLGQP
ncbi:MAG TPA: hypothetical protein VHX36_08920 [Candidatus Acidoferrales bacterium]|jgi:hypothetical protein|nr:hypothetical protein [Candidatus Acidoferrales bacterium]